MTHMTTLDELKQHITELASVEASDAPFISCYLNLENGQPGWREVLDDRARILRRILKGDALGDFDEALGKALKSMVVWTLETGQKEMAASRAKRK